MSEVAERIRPGRSPEFDRRHGQQVTPLQGGGVFMTAHKVVRDDFRAALLLLPGIMRVDVRPLGDTLHVVARPLHERKDLWGARNTTRSAWDRPAAESDVPWHGTWICMLATRPLGVLAKVDVYAARVAGRQASHFLAHAVVRASERDLSGVV